MTRVSEHGFSIDLPGVWVADEDVEPGGLRYRQADGDGVVTVMLLSVKPLFEIADKRRLLADYVDHRCAFEVGSMPDLVQYEEEIVEQADGTLEAFWSGEVPDSAYHQRHRALLSNDVLVDVCFGASAESAVVFDVGAVMVLASMTFEADAPGADG